MERIEIGGVTLEGFAQGGWQTAIHCPEIGVTFDMGVRLPANVDRYFLTHGHPDHSAALPSIVARRALQGSTKPIHVHVPAVLAPQVEALVQATEALHGGRRGPAPIEVHATQIGDAIQIHRGHAVRAVRTYHDAPACGWAVERTTKKLRPEFQEKSAPELAALRQTGADLTEEKTQTLLVVPGDTKIEFLLRCKAAQQATVLTHEVTYWDEKSSPEKCRQYGHTHVDEMIEHCEKFEGDCLVLVHRSLKYSRRDVERIVSRRFPSAMRSKIVVFDGGDR